MTNQAPIDLLGKHISEISDSYTSSTINSINEEIYVVDVSDQFLGKPYKMIFLTVDKNSIIQNFIIHTNEIMNKSFYNLMLKEYGKPSVMYKEGEVVSQGKKTTDKDGFTMQSTAAAFKKCTFEESPRFIIWNKDGYDIEVMLGHETDTFRKTTITFGKGTLTNYLSK